MVKVLNVSLLAIIALGVIVITFANGEAISVELADLYNNAKPLHIQIRTPEIWNPESDQSKFTTNEPYSGAFSARAECSDNKTDLKLGQHGTVSSPNYPKNYPANMACEWQLEGPPGSRIQAVFFDVYTQPWFFAYFDYVMVARNGNFTNVDRMSGDMNGKTPMVVLSEANKLGIRFRSSSLFNFRGFKAQYLVVPDPNFQQEEGAPPPPPVPELERPAFDGICGYPSVQPEVSTTTFASSSFASETFSTTEGFSSTYPVESSSTEGESSTDASSSSVSTGSTPEIVSESSSSSESTTQAGSSSEFPIVLAPYNESQYYRASQQPQEDIVGGSEALKYSYPWMAALLIDGRHFCGGSLIDDQHIVTAAHCTNRANEIKILLGTHNIKAQPGEEGSRVLYNITRANIFQHPEYNENTISHDISILRLPQKINFTDRIKPVCLPNRRYLPEFFTDQEARVSGWGKPADDAPGVSPWLKEADVKVMPNNQCRLAFRGIVTGNLICVATKTNASPCKGDSGGPLMVKEVDPITGQEYYVLTGIVSFGSLTCERGLPVGFTRITAFLDYVNEVTGKEL